MNPAPSIWQQRTFRNEGKACETNQVNLMGNLFEKGYILVGVIIGAISEPGMKAHIFMVLAKN